MTDETIKDRERAIAAAKAIIDRRSPSKDGAEILVSLEGAVALVLLAVMDKDPDKAARMLNEGLITRVEERLALSKSRGLGAF